MLTVHADVDVAKASLLSCSPIPLEFGFDWLIASQ